MEECGGDGVLMVVGHGDGVLMMVGHGDGELMVACERLS